MTVMGIPGKDDKDAQIEFLKEALCEIKKIEKGEVPWPEEGIAGFVDSRLMDVTY